MDIKKNAQTKEIEDTPKSKIFGTNFVGFRGAKNKVFKQSKSFGATQGGFLIIIKNF